MAEKNSVSTVQVAGQSWEYDPRQQWGATVCSWDTVLHGFKVSAYFSDAASTCDVSLGKFSVELYLHRSQDSQDEFLTEALEKATEVIHDFRHRLSAAESS